MSKPYGELLRTAMEAQTQDQADAMFGILVAESMMAGKSEAEALELTRGNLGYFAGYYSHEVRERVERLYKCEHPVFGSIAKNGPPTPEAALEAGIELAKKP